MRPLLKNVLVATAESVAFAGAALSQPYSGLGLDKEDGLGGDAGCSGYGMGLGLGRMCGDGDGAHAGPAFSDERRGEERCRNWSDR